MSDEIVYARPLEEQDYINAAKIIRCEVAAVKAVKAVESNGAGFLSDGRVKILFEAHKFHLYTKGKYADTHRSICAPYPESRKYYAKGRTADERGKLELARLELAMSLDERAAIMSASYGLFQVMGFNHGVCGYTDPYEFFRDMCIDEAHQLEIFCKYIMGVGLDDELRRHDWTNFARLYNGKDYQKNNYPAKLLAAYNRSLVDTPLSKESGFFSK